ncbi:MAG TPA: 3-dehydroquinate synthase [Cellvibrio sp.]|nr:3-dehydroquinate synthase [Cellvibrio sp.]
MYQIDQRFTVSYEFPVCFTRAAFAVDNLVVRNVVARAGNTRHKLFPVFDEQVLASQPELLSQLQGYAEQHSDIIELILPPLMVRSGEICKTDPIEVEQFYRITQERNIDRHSFVLVVGGGSVIDAIGYAAATAHRGIRLIRMPTTVLGQNDAGVGVKNAVNFLGRKNYLGTFVPPYAVINDFNFLRTLPLRDQCAGMVEAVKVALIKDQAFFDWLYQQRHQLAMFKDDAVEYMIRRCAELHLHHIASSGDPFEYGSARPLDFGHWAAHRLEEISHSDLRHGEAVAIGVTLDSLYSHALGLIDEALLQKIIVTLKDIGFSLYHPALEELNIHKALQDFREHLGGELCITLLTGEGVSAQYNQIDENIMLACAKKLVDL